MQAQRCMSIFDKGKVSKTIVPLAQPKLGPPIALTQTGGPPQAPLSFMTRNNNHFSTSVPRVPKELQPRREDPQIFESSTDLPTSPVCPTTNPGGFGLWNKRMQTKFRDPSNPVLHRILWVASSHGLLSDVS